MDLMFSDLVVVIFRINMLAPFRLSGVQCTVRIALVLPALVLLMGGAHPLIILLTRQLQQGLLQGEVVGERPSPPCRRRFPRDDCRRGRETFITSFLVLWNAPLSVVGANALLPARFGRSFKRVSPPVGSFGSGEG